MAIYVVGSSRDMFPELDAGRIKFLVDTGHDGDNIDSLNPWYCETTALYHMWKNSDAELVGLEHYRRYLTSPGHGTARITCAEAGSILSAGGRYSMIVTEYSHGPSYRAIDWFRDSGNLKWLDIFMEVNPGIADAFMGYLCRHSLIQCNMFIGFHEVVSRYCEWLFPMLGAFDRAAVLDDRNRRIDGYIAEHIFGMWLEMNKIPFLRTGKVEIRYVGSNQPVNHVQA